MTEDADTPRGPNGTDRQHPFRDSRQDARVVKETPDTPQTRAPAYRLAFTDTDFLMREELRPVRLQLELLKPEMILAERGIRSTVVLMGSARIPREGEAGPGAALSGWYEVARDLAQRITDESLKTYGRDSVVMTGGGPGIMEAGNEGAAAAGGQSIGLNIVLPHEQAPNPFVTPDLCFNFHYFAIRKMHFLMRARAVCVFPGGFGTLDELMECLTLIQTGRMQRIPILLFGREFWDGVINWQALVDAGTIAESDLSIFSYVETAEDAMALLHQRQVF
ncbi:DNA-binding protein [Haematobacter missouriensis]|uniref:Cytokinin riboside 5'-monophosphate phosphoribohydrolase n=1 Tax=Haematobacter missouriensis TaxID=366616 RepID=A0A212AV20_9RHOB|nr:TIGR00730 family Rossman fold protein [Haematobacter missouriensis]KFI33854.1 DNA-binding protein [Haematobacter missouriensis]OWJ72222.1 Rossman fold protein, TIGR00730 family [Haematobacter missouriensis]OWJ85332.1 Rossman fold protein, TIGR00730 family [Haematobacter missouriensis]